ncbi:hypothetical protein L9F63_002567, partial [Diploptera punctata]
IKNYKLHHFLSNELRVRPSSIICNRSGCRVQRSPVLPLVLRPAINQDPNVNCHRLCVLGSRDKWIAKSFSCIINTK